jgi:hypothetical protein
LGKLVVEFVQSHTKRQSSSKSSRVRKAKRIGYNSDSFGVSGRMD